MVRLEGGMFLMGHNGSYGYPDDGEGPMHPVEVSPFWIDPVTVSNARFLEFTEATGHVTDAEAFGWSFVFAGFLPDDFPPTRASAQAPWWRVVEGADWRHPEGPQSEIGDRSGHPVVHVSWNDAVAYCNWSGLSLPSEAGWEYAARGGMVQKRFPWGNQREPDGEHRMNVWQGEFPANNTVEDGYAGTAPVDSFQPNGYGLCNTTGNVWEWCSDWFDPEAYRIDTGPDPTGPDQGTHRVMRGGSYLCHESYCYRYRVDARSANTPDSSAGNIGFRVARGE
jgi:formylglycine-generating enzyme required for sulfatase activity